MTANYGISTNQTRQVYNLFQDLWNQAFFHKVAKKVQKTVQTLTEFGKNQ